MLNNKQDYRDQRRIVRENVNEMIPAYNPYDLRMRVSRHLTTTTIEMNLRSLILRDLGPTVESST